jgi:hypothetical protein
VAEAIAVTRWLFEGAIPAGALVTVLDQGDGDPQAAFAAGFDVVLHLGGEDAELLSGRPFLLTILWRDGLASELGREPPPPIRVRKTAHGFVRVDEAAA